MGLGLRDRKGRREEAVSMTNIHLTHLARTQHRICLLLQRHPQPPDHSSASLPPLINPECPQQRLLTEQSQNRPHIKAESPNLRSAGAQALQEEGTCLCPSCCQDASSGSLIQGCACLTELCQQNCFIRGISKGSSYSLGAEHLHPSLSLVTQTSPSPQHGESYALTAGLVPSCL